MAALEQPEVIPGQVDIYEAIAEVEKEQPKVFTSVTPSGITVEYCPSPRFYRVKPAEWREYPGDEDTWKVPSVTAVLGCLEKPLSWWGQSVGIAGVLELLNRGVLKAEQNFLLDAALGGVTAEDIARFLTQEKLTVNHQLTKAGDRGTSVHSAFEEWAVNGTIPHPEIYPDSERPYVEGLKKFLLDFGPCWEIQAEVMVGSIQHQYAGRYDLRCRWGGGPMVVKTYPKRANKVEELPAGEVLIDLKTSSGIYPSQMAQLEAYELASVEDGYKPTDARYILHVTKTGEYELVRSKATGDDFLAILGCYRALEDLKGRK